MNAKQGQIIVTRLQLVPINGDLTRALVTKDTLEMALPAFLDMQVIFNNY